MNTIEKPYSEACARNREPILQVLREHFADRHHVLEIGSGTGQHAVHFAAAMPQLIWQTSDRREYLPGLRLWLDEAGLPNTPPPLTLDVVADPWPAQTFDAIFTANTLHIMSWSEVETFFARLPSVLAADAVLAVYGPFNRDGQFTTPSNAAFDAALKSRDPKMGLRDLAAVDALASSIGLTLIDDRALPANNDCIVWRRTAVSPA
jgi:cyclopropane fatty-acyl-phospholipid synthase-like methyltransferase